MSDARFAPRPVVLLLDELADAFGWPRSRPVRVGSGDRAQFAAKLALCTSEAALSGLDHADDSVAVFAVPPPASEGRAGRRSYDPFVDTGDDVSNWRRSERVTLDAALLISGGAGGVDERLAERLGLASIAGPVRAVDRDVRKFTGYVPPAAADAVADAVFAAGAGTIGAYDRCAWSTPGTGTFRGGEGTNPTVGTPGSLEQVEELRFETIVPSHLVPAVVAAYVAAHPYEEPAFDVYELRMPSPVGFGRVGTLGVTGAAAEAVIAEIDPEAQIFGALAGVAAGEVAAVHVGSVREILRELLVTDGLALVVACAATDAEVQLLHSRGAVVAILDRARTVDAFADDIAGRLSRTLTLPVSVARGLSFPDGGTTTSPPETEPAPSGAATVSSDVTHGTWRLHFDGGSRGNPGPAAYGWVLYDPDGNETATDGVMVGHATNNVAEWTGLLRGLEYAADLGIRALSVRGDSELVVKQVTGVYRVKNAALKPIANNVSDVLERFEHVDIKHVYRADNARADAVANEAMDGLR